MNYAAFRLSSNGIEQNTTNQVKCPRIIRLGLQTFGMTYDLKRNAYRNEDISIQNSSNGFISLILSIPFAKNFTSGTRHSIVCVSHSAPIRQSADVTQFKHSFRNRVRLIRELLAKRMGKGFKIQVKITMVH